MRKGVYGIISLAIIIAVITNPKKEQHTYSIAKKSFKILKSIDKNNVKGIDTKTLQYYVNEDLDLNNYVLFSICGNSIKNFSFGMFGNVVLLESEEQMRKSFEKSTKTPITKTAKKKHFKITDIATGYIATSYHWTPTIYFKVNRLIKQKNPPFVKVKTIFYDSNNRKVSTTISNFEPFNGNNKYFLIKAKKGYQSTTTKKLKAKIFIDNEFVKEVNIIAADFHRR